MYALVAFHDAIRFIFAFAAACDLIFKGGDVANAYLYGDIDSESSLPTLPERKQCQIICLSFKNICTA